jgi:LCP family protein required for cell wall assembly
MGKKDVRPKAAGASNDSKKKKKRTRRILLFTIELLLLAVMVVVLYRLYMVKEVDEPNIIYLDRNDLGIAEQVEEETVLKGYRNVALFGVDATTEEQLYKNSRSDSIMIASINLDTGDIKLVSVYRDTYLNIGNDEYMKCNTAYSYGGAEQAIKMLNGNLDLDIVDFITVGYEALTEAVNGLGGVWIDVDSEELKHINNYQQTIADLWDVKYTKVTETGYQLLNGLQASAYCRIRYTKGDDFKRAERQREVIKAMEVEAKKASLSTLTKVFEEVAGDIYTSLNQEDVLTLLTNIQKYQISDENGFPQEDLRINVNAGGAGAVVAPNDLVSNVLWLHEFLFDNEEYVVSDRVEEYSGDIKSKISKYLQ